MACKIEEVYVPTLRELSFITAKACLPDEIRDLEPIMLSVLDFQVCKRWRFYFAPRLRPVRIGVVINLHE